MPVPKFRKSASGRHRVGAKVVLRVLAGLRAIRVQDLNLIDGEFYYRCCLPHVEALLNRARTRDMSDPEQIQQYVDVFHDLWHYYHLPQQDALDAVRNGSKLPLRSSEVTLSKGDDQGDAATVADATHVSMNVYSSSVRGPAVSEKFIAACQSLGLPLGARIDDDETVSKAHVRVTLVDGNTAARMGRRTLDGGWEWVEMVPVTAQDGYYRVRDEVGPPHLRVDVKLPLPSADVIAAQYDAVWRQCHDKIGQGAGQDPETAMRTWTIALFMTSGLNFGQALGEWLRLSPGARKISDTRFDEDKALLFSRVPEAREYLLRRKCAPFGRD
jgi:hypothetical protein